MLTQKSISGAARVGIARDAFKVMAQSASTATAPPAIKASVAPLFTPFKLGRFELAHRMVYPPLTRNRGTPDNVPNSTLAAEYYSQRATPGGLLITEGTYINETSSGYPDVPGLWNEKQVEAWKPITKAVHDKGAIFFTQIWHVGRAAHPDLIGGRTPVAPSVNKPSGQVWLGGANMADYVDPHALTKEEIKGIVGDFRKAARNALAAGFDGVEIHGANGYLIDQFLKSSTNQRTDEYGGSIEKRIRFALEVVAAVTEEVGADRVGLRLSPFTNFLDAVDDTPYATFVALIEQLNKVAPKLAYLHMIEARIQGNTENNDTQDTLEPFRKLWRGPFIAAGGYNAEAGAAAIASGHADLVAWGRLWIANPDLPKRFQLGAPLNRYDRNTFYGGGAKGYTDYPFLAK